MAVGRRELGVLRQLWGHRGVLGWRGGGRRCLTPPPPAHACPRGRGAQPHPPTPPAAAMKLRDAPSACPSLWRCLPCPPAELRLDLVLSSGQTFR